MCWGSSIHSASQRTVISCPSVYLVSFTETCTLNISIMKNGKDMRFSQKWILRCSRMWCYVLWNNCTNNLGDDSAACIRWVEIRYHTGGGGHIVISLKVKYILYSYFSENWRLWRSVILYAWLVWYTILHNLLPPSAALPGISNSRLQFQPNLGSTVMRFEVVISMTEDYWLLGCDSM
jgi:hypothetical protein